MKHTLFGPYSGPLVALGGLVALACVLSIGYINRLQTDLARTVRHDAAGMEAAVELQVQLRHLRVHSLVFVADQVDSRRELVLQDFTQVDDALATIRQVSTKPDDIQLVRTIERDYLAYKAGLDLGRLPRMPGMMADVARWSDEHHMAGLLTQCQELADRQRSQMNASLVRTEAQTAFAGRVLIGLGLTGVLAGLFSGYAAARWLTRRVAQLFVRVQAVHAHLDQDVGAMTVEAPQHLGELDTQLDRVVDRVKEVCKRLQEQERDLLRAEQLAAVGQLAAGIAHEIRNPLTGVKFLLQAAARPQNATPLTLDRLQLLLQEVARIERTVQSLVDFARAPQTNRQPCDLRELVAAATELSRSRAEAKSLALEVELPPQPIPATVDRDQMLSLLTNLLTNAIEATPTGGTVAMRATTAANGILTVAVTDTGPGIDATIADRLFTPFATTKPTGTGLGLTIARRIAQDHGGTLTAGNRPEGGACFTMTLPARESHAEAPDRR